MHWKVVPQSHVIIFPSEFLPKSLHLAGGQFPSLQSAQQLEGWQSLHQKLERGELQERGGHERQLLQGVKDPPADNLLETGGGEDGGGAEVEMFYVGTFPYDITGGLAAQICTVNHTLSQLVKLDGAL